MALSYLVLPDSHGEYERVAHIIKQTDKAFDIYVFLGDVLDGHNSAQLMQLIRGLGERAVTIAGNHEWVCRNALSVADDPAVEIWRDQVWPGYEDNVLTSYGLQRTPDWQQNAAALRATMQERGDLEWLEGLRPYVETDQFIGVHAGPKLNIAWTLQAQELDGLDTTPTRLADEPPQLFSHALAQLQAVPETVSEKTFVTGHGHSQLAWNQRAAGRRVCLASNVTRGEPFYVWDALTRQISTYCTNY